MGYEMRYLANLIHEKDIFTSTKETVHVLELEKTIDPIVFDELANHFRRCYCNDAIIDRLIWVLEGESSIGMYGIRTDRAFRNDNRLRKW